MASTSGYSSLLSVNAFLVTYMGDLQGRKSSDAMALSNYSSNVLDVAIQNFRASLWKLGHSASRSLAALIPNHFFNHKDNRDLIADHTPFIVKWWSLTWNLHLSNHQRAPLYYCTSPFGLWVSTGRSGHDTCRAQETSQPPLFKRAAGPGCPKCWDNLNSGRTWQQFQLETYLNTAADIWLILDHITNI